MPCRGQSHDIEPYSSSLNAQISIFFHLSFAHIQFICNILTANAGMLYAFDWKVDWIYDNYRAGIHVWKCPEKTLNFIYNLLWREK